MCHNKASTLWSFEPQQYGEEVHIGVFWSRCFEGLLRPNWSLLPEDIITRKGEGWKECPRHGWRGGISRDQFPILACAFSLDAPSFSTLGIQEKYLAHSDQSVEQEAMKL